MKYYSIGCDCHPAIVLTHLNLRLSASPFDWLNTNVINTFEYFLDLVQTNFIHFMSDIQHDKLPYSKYYPYSTFYHDTNIIQDSKIKEKYNRRIGRFMNDFNNSKCLFLTNIKAESISSHQSMNKLCSDCNDIISNKTFITNHHILYIYILYNENYDENKLYCDKFYNQIQSLNKSNIKIIKYCRHLTIKGIWGDKNEYNQYLKDISTIT